MSTLEEKLKEIKNKMKKKKKKKKKDGREKTSANENYRKSRGMER